MSQQTANSIVNVSKYHMVGRLLGVVDSQLKAAVVVSPEHVGANLGCSCQFWMLH